MGLIKIEFNSKLNAFEVYNLFKDEKDTILLDSSKEDKNLSKYSFNKNRANFWAFLASNNAQYLQELSQSKNVDMYTLASLEMTKEEPKFNIVYDVQTQDTRATWNSKDPFEWQRIRDSFKSHKTKDKNLAQQFLSQTNNADTKAHYVFLSREKGKEYFLMPYKEAFSKFSNDKQALLYALARQESLFIPTAISTSYALGIMQLMPFNVKAIAKELNQEKSCQMLNPMIKCNSVHCGHLQIAQFLLCTL